MPSGAALLYERTCGTESAAEERCAIIRERGRGAFYTVDALPSGSWFY